MKRKVKTGHKKKKKKLKNGFVRIDRTKFREDGNVLITGQARTCLPDALCCLLGVEDAEPVRAAIMGGDLYTDALLVKAQYYVETLGRWLPGVTREFDKTGGLAYHIVMTTGRKLLLHLHISDGPEDEDPDHHCVAYDGLHVMDNNSRKKPIRIVADDRSSVRRARAVFDALYPTMHVRIHNVYELK